MSSLTNVRFARMVVSTVQEVEELRRKNAELLHSNQHLLEVIEEYKRLQQEEYVAAVVVTDVNGNPDFVNPDYCNVNP